MTRRSSSVMKCVWGSGWALVILLLARIVFPTSMCAADDYVVAGRLVESKDRQPVANVTIRLVMHEGRNTKSKVVASVQTDQQGSFRFESLVWPRYTESNPATYYVMLDDPDYPLVIQQSYQHNKPQQMLLWAYSEQEIVSGQVLDQSGAAIAGATVHLGFRAEPDIPGVTSVKTNPDGHFQLQRVPIRVDKKSKKPWLLWVTSSNHVNSQFRRKSIGQQETFILKTGCRVRGSVKNVEGNPVPGLRVEAFPTEINFNQVSAITDDAGRYEMSVAEGNYHFATNSPNLVAPAISDIQCRSGKTIQLDPMTATKGGWLTGRVVHPKTQKPVVWTSVNTRIGIGIIGPLRPAKKFSGGEYYMAEVEDDGRFRIRVASGDYYPNTGNQQSNRMSWDREKHAPVQVAEGGVARCRIEIKLPEDPIEIMASAQAKFEKLPKDRDARVSAIVAELGRLCGSVNETDYWCLLLKDLVEMGPDAVPLLCKELQQTDKNVMIRWLAFVLRGIGDARAVPTLIQTIPKTLHHGGSDYGLMVHDPDLAATMRDYQIKAGVGAGKRFSFGRPIREVFAALQKMTKQEFNENELFSVHVRKHPRSRSLQEAMFLNVAKKWAVWWEANYQDLGMPDEFRKIDLPELSKRVPVESDPTIVAGTKLDSSHSNWVLSPINEKKAQQYFLDLDTGYVPAWPADLAHDGSKEGIRAATEWAEKNGVDLMCAQLPNKSFGTYTLQAVNTKLWQIDPLDAKNIKKHLKSGTLKRGQAIDRWIAYHTPEGKVSARRGSSFLFQTSEGILGLITVTDLVTKKKDVTGQFMETPGAGFNVGVRFKFKTFVAP